MTVQAVPISEITLDPENKRRHDEKNLAAIRRSLERFGQQSPIVLDSSGRCLKGNGTILAAQALGWQEIQAVHSDLEGRDADAYAVADNRAGELATWEQQQLAQFLEDQRNLGDLECTGFDEEDLDALADGWDIATAQPPDLASGDRAPFQQMTFTLHDEQVERVKAALAAAKEAGPFVDTENENSNGNALARIVEAFLG